MKPTLSSFLLILILLLSADYFCIDYANNLGTTTNAIDPLLFIHGYSATSTTPRDVKALVTSPSPLTLSQRAMLGSLGVVKGSIGRVTTVQLPLTDIEEVAKFDFVSGVFGVRSYHPTLDVSGIDIGAAYVWGNVTDARGKSVDGSGVVVGIIDTGVDLSHPDLKFPNGTSKVVYLWDQTISGKPPGGFTYGVECSWGDINGGKCAERDTFGHGTHVASIVVSSGLASGKYRGIAPGASLIVVKSGSPICGESWTFEDSGILDGLQYLVDRARTLGKRLVINLSLGGNIGGHDDSSPLELILNDLSTRGVVVIVAAGNEANSGIHVSGSLSGTNPSYVGWAPADQARNMIIDLWYQSDRVISATLVTPSGEAISGPTKPGGTKTADGLVNILPSATAKGKELTVSVETLGALRTSGWNLTLNGPENGPDLAWEAWVDSDSCSYPTASFLGGFGYKVDMRGTVTVPGTASGVITVGAYVSKNSWTSLSEKKISAQDYLIGDIAGFTSRGPTRDGRTKPEVSAPGLFITAARSSDVPPDDNDPDQYHRVLAGTSMAAPHVAGVAALMLQFQPKLTPQELRSRLVEGTTLDSFTGPIDQSRGSNEWGWGKVDARTATSLFRVSSIVKSLPSTFAVDLIVDGQSHGLVHGGEVTTLRFLSGTTHSFVVETGAFTTNSTRYVVNRAADAFSANGIFSPTVRVQYLLSLESPIGETDGGGWYNAGSYANFTVRIPELQRALIQLLGIDLSFDRWLDEHGNVVSADPSGSLRMGAPHTLRGSWGTRISDWVSFTVLATLLIIIVLVVQSRKRRPRIEKKLT